MEKKLAVGLLAVVVLLGGTVVSSEAWNDGHWHGGWRGGWHGGWHRPVFFGPRFVVGVPFIAPPLFAYAPPPVIYTPPAVLVPPAAVAAPGPVYTQTPQYWYYCSNPSGYYPSVPQCPRGWLQVAPQQYRRRS